jgi:ferric-dicitrate binding protein FerR (iron transport regulator)
MKKETIIRYFNNQCTESEVEEVFLWIKENALNKESSRWASEKWDLCMSGTEEGLKNDEKFGALFDKIQRKIDEIHKGKKAEVRKTLFITWLTRVAAILLIPVLGIFIYMLLGQRFAIVPGSTAATDSIEVVSPAGARIKVLLSDGSEVFLNSGSRLKYLREFSGNTRNVELLGEGYFKVSHNPDKPFIVEAGKLNIKAVGTSFNVLAYPDKDEIEATLVEGKVILEHSDEKGNVRSLGAMLPGQHIKYNIQTGIIHNTRGNVEKYIAWKDGKLIFEDAPINQVAGRLNQMFNVDIKVDSGIRNYVYTVTFEDEPLSRILELLVKAIPELEYKVLPQKKLPNGTFSKQQIIIEKK